MYDVLRLRVLVAIVVMSCIVSCSRDPENGSAFTHEDILTVLRDQEGRINDFLLEYDNEETKKMKVVSLSAANTAVSCLWQRPICFAPG